MDSKFEARLAEQIAGSGLLGRVEGHLLSASAAKRVRPRFLFTCGSLLNVPTALLVDEACAVELIHTASLLHDDVVDAAPERRGLPSVNAAFGNKVAVLGGDTLLARAQLLLTSRPRAQDVLRVTAEAFFKMTEAALLEIDLHNHKNVTPEILLTIADGKAGALFALCGSLAGIAANDDEATERLALAGRLLGRVFQIKDDVDDVEEDAGNDILTLPLLIGVAVALKEAQRSIDEALTALEPFRGQQAYEPLVTTIRKVARMEPLEIVAK